MKRMRRIPFVFVLMLAAANVTVIPSPASADASCASDFRRAFQKVTEPMRQMMKAIDAWSHRKGRAQARKVEKIIEEQWRISQKNKPADPEGAWQEHIRKWEEDVMERMRENEPKKKGYPEVEELLAVMAAKSPTYRVTMTEFLTSHHTIKYKALGYLAESSKASPKVTRKLFDLWRKRLRIGTFKPWTTDDFSFFIAETSNVMWRSMHPERFMWEWAKSLGTLRVNPKTWKVREVFAKRFQEKFRTSYRQMMEATTMETYGKVRPDIIRDFQRFGMHETVMRRLLAYEIIMSKRGTAAIEEYTGLTIEEVNQVHKRALYDLLPQRLKNAAILAKNPHLYDHLLLSAEVEQLIFEIMWWTKPVIWAIDFVPMIVPAFMKKKADEQDPGEQFENESKAMPQQMQQPTLPQASERKYEISGDARIKSLDEDIDFYTLRLRDIQKDLESPGLSPQDRAQKSSLRDKTIAKINRLNSIKIFEEREKNKVHP